MLNRSILIGRLTRDPELRYTPKGVATCSFTLAVERPFQNNGQKEADFIPIVTWRQLAEVCANYLSKGRMTAIEGRIQVRNYDNNEGKRVYVTEVIADNVRFLERGEGGQQVERMEQDSPDVAQSRHNASGNNYPSDEKPIDISDDDLPF